MHPLWIIRRGLRRALARHAGQVRGRLLDVGCGWKPYAPLFAGRVTHYVGVELPTSRSASGVVDVYASGLALPFRWETFDAVLCTEVLEHVPEPERLLNEAARVLRPGGVLLLTVPWLWAVHEAPHDYYRYTEFGLRHLLEVTGFVDVRVDRTTGLAASAAQRLVAASYYGLRLDRTAAGTLVGGVGAAVLQVLGTVADSALGHRGETLNLVAVARRGAWTEARRDRLPAGGSEQ